MENLRDIIQELIVEGLWVLVFVMYGLGLIIKSTERIKDKYIPLILLGTSIAFTIPYYGFVLENGFTPAAITLSITQGVLIAAVAVFGNQVWKQSKKEE